MGAGAFGGGGGGSWCPVIKRALNTDHKFGAINLPTHGHK